MMEALKDFESEEFKNFDEKTQREFVDFWVDNTYKDDENYKNFDDKTKQEFKNSIADKYVDKGIVDTTIGYLEDAGHGASVAIDEYGASINKGLDAILPESVSDAIGLKENQKFWNDRKEAHKAAINNEYAGLAGEIVGDPMNLTPVGIFNKGSKVARVAKSAVAGAGVGAGTMAFKNYGDDSLTDEQKLNQDIFSGGIVATLNGIIAGVTKGRVVDAVKDIPQDAKPQEVIDGIMKNPEAFGLSKEETPTLVEEIQKYTHPKVPEEFKKETVRPQKPYEPDFIQVPQHPPAVIKEIDKDIDGWNKLGEEIHGTPLSKEPITENLTPERKIQALQSQIAQSNRKAEFEKSVDSLEAAAQHEADAQKYSEELAKIQEEIKPPEPEVKNLLEHPRLDELLDMRKDVLAKDIGTNKKLVQRGSMRELSGNNGTDKQAYDKAVFEKNYANDFMITKLDVAKIKAGKADQKTMDKLEHDLGVMDNHPDYAPQTMSDTDWKEANAVFAKGTDNLAVGAYAGIDQDENGNITFDPEKFIVGLGGYTAVKELVKNPKVQQELKDYVQKNIIDEVDNGTSPKANWLRSITGQKNMFVGAADNEAGAFSDIATKKTMKEIDDSNINYNPIPKQQVEFDGVQYDQNFAKLGDIVDHPALFEKYPELKDTKVSLNNNYGRGGSYNGAIDHIALDKDNTSALVSKEMEDIKTQIRTLASNPLDEEYTKLHEKLVPGIAEDEAIKVLTEIDKTPTQKAIDALDEKLSKLNREVNVNGERALNDYGKNTLLHEVQHAVQQKEGWAKGGSPYSVTARDMYDTLTEKYGNLPAFEKIYNDFLDSKIATEDEAYSKMINMAVPNYEGGLKGLQHDTYKRLWGEQQSRATELRKDFTPEQRQSEAWTDTLAKKEGEYKEPIIKYDTAVSEMSPVKMGDNSASTLDDVKETLEKHRGTYADIAYTKENWNSLFPDSKVTTPLGEVKLGENQFEKLDPTIPDPKFPQRVKQDRRHHLSYIEQTLKEPAFAISKENGEKLLFFKEIENGSKQKQYSSIMIDTDGLHVNISNHPMNYKQIKNEINKNDVVYIAPEDAAGKTATPHPSSEFADKDIIPQNERVNNLKEWHKESDPLTKNEDGTPKVFYHGTKADFDQFSTNVDKVNGSRAGEGFYLTSNPDVANSYAKDGSVMPVYINANKVYTGVNNLSDAERNIYMKSEKPVNETLQDLGFDARMNGDEIVVFHPEQIKSVNNSGTFSGENPNILFANAGHSMAGGFAGGADSLINQRDYDGNGEYDYKDLLAGVVAGTISINALKKIAPKLFEENAYEGIKIGAFGGDAQKEVFQESVKNAKAKGYEHLRKIVGDEAAKDWGDASKTFKRAWVDTLSKEYHDVRENTMAAINGESMKLERLHNTLNELDAADRKNLHNYIAGVDENLDDGLKPLANKIKEDIHILSKDLVERKVLSEDEFRAWEYNYVHRSYDKYFMQDIKSLFKQGFKIDEIHKRGKIEILSAKKAKEFKDSVEPEIFSKALKDGGYRMKSIPGGKFELRRDWTQAEREQMKEITDGSITIPETLMRLKRLNENAKFLQEIEQIDDVVLRDAEQFTDDELSKQGYARAPKNIKYGVLAGKPVRKDVLDDIKGINNETFNTFGEDGALARVWRGYLTTWKKSKTVWNLPSHVNNFLSNTFLMHLSGMGPLEITTALGRAGKMMVHGNAYEELLRKKELGTATKKNLEELTQMGEDLKYFIEAKEGGLLGRSNLNDVLAGQQNNQKATSLLSKIDKFTQDAYHNGDAINRIAMYAHLRDKVGLEADEARKMVLSIMPDYSKPMAVGYRWLRDTGISPFISWSYYTVPSIYKLIKTKQGAVQAAKALGSFAALEYVLSNGEVTPLDNIPFMDTKKPEEFKGRRFVIGVDGDKVNTIKVDRWIPYIEMQNPINFGLSQISGPSTKAITNISTLTSKGGPVDTYTGRPITYANKKAAQKAYDYTKYLVQSYVPLPAQAYTGWNIGESMLRDQKSRKRNQEVVPRTSAQEALKFGGINTLTYSKRGLRDDQKKEK